MRTGRPIGSPPPPGLRSVNVGLVMPGSLKRSLIEAATFSGRSLSAEISYRLQRSFDNDEVLSAIKTLSDRVGQ